MAALPCRFPVSLLAATSFQCCSTCTTASPTAPFHYFNPNHPKHGHMDEMQRCDPVVRFSKIAGAKFGFKSSCKGCDFANGKLIPEKHAAASKREYRSFIQTIESTRNRWGVTTCSPLQKLRLLSGFLSTCRYCRSESGRFHWEKHGHQKRNCCFEPTFRISARNVINVLERLKIHLGLYAKKSFCNSLQAL